MKLIDDSLLAAWNDWLTFRSMSQSCRKKYAKELRRFAREMQLRDTNGFTKESITSYVVLLHEKYHVSGGYIAVCLYALKNFWRYLKEENLINWQWDIRVPFRKRFHKVLYLTLEDIKILFDTLDYLILKKGNIHALRLRTFIEVMLNTGLRPSETLSLNREVIDRNLAEFEIIGKGGKKRTIIFTDRARAWCKKYLAARFDSSPALFVSHCEANRLSLRRSEDAFKELMLYAGIAKPATLHTIRHTYASLMLNEGAPIEHVAHLLGHSSIATTRAHYFGVDFNKAKEAPSKYLKLE